MAEDFDHFPAMAAALPRLLSQAVRKVALDIQATAAANAPVDTGFLRASIYTVTSRSSNYGQGRASGTKNLVKSEHQELFEEVAPPDDDMTAYVAVGASYGIYVEEGTRYMPAQPYFYPAVDAGDAVLQEVLDIVAERLMTVTTGSAEVIE